MPAEERIALPHPTPGKMGAIIERAKYDQMRAAILAILGRSDSLTYTQLADALELTTAPDSDYWQRTHYGFRRDNGHFFCTPVRGDFVLSARFTGTPNAQYDQCGLLVRADSESWVKCLAEYETPTHSRLGSVVTNHGYSDWATQDVAGAVPDLWYRLRRTGDDVFIDWSEDGAAWRQMRVAHLHRCPAKLLAGVYACSPTGPGFDCRVSDLKLETVGAADPQGTANA